MDQTVKSLSREQIEAYERSKVEAERVANIEPPTFVDQDRSLTIDLMFPLKYDGKVYEKITVTRPTIRQWRKYMANVSDAIQKGGSEAADSVDPPYLDIPAIVYESLDYIDGSRVDAAVDGFFGRSSLQEEEASGETPNADSTSSNGEQSPSS
jgi:hypothetical protein